jgi:hypothetical protein
MMCMHVQRNRPPLHHLVIIITISAQTRRLVEEMRSLKEHMLDIT